MTTPQAVALADVRKELNFCRKVELPILGVVENMSGFVCPHCAVTAFESSVLRVGMYQYILDRRRRSYGRRVRSTVSGYISEKPELTVGRAPIDPNFVLAIERNQQNQINGVGDAVANGASGISTIVDEYQQLALYDVFKGIVSNLIAEDNKMQE